MEAITRPLKRYLYFTAAVSGAGVMIIEILGAKVLAPYLGTSHFVWTAQIAVTLVALSAGYWVGGRLADWAPRPGVLFGCLLAAATTLCLTVLIVEPVAQASVDLDLALGSLLASTVLYFVPLGLLAMTGPFLIRILSRSVGEVGARAGGLYALSTMGSVAGTLLIGYVLIPLAPNSVILLVTAGCFFALAAAYALVWGRRTLKPLPVAVSALAIGLGSLGAWREMHPPFEVVEEVFRGNSNFGILQVLKQKGENRILYLNDLITQNTYDPVEKKSLSLFTYMLHGLARAYTREVKDVLCIGMGAGIVPMEFAREGADVDVVEINPAVVPLARRFLGFEPERVHLTIGDGRQFLNRTKRHYDVIVVDAFLGDSSPSHLLSREAFAAMARLLKPGGTVVMNTFAAFEGGHGYFCASLEKTLRAVFTGVAVHPSRRGNVFFVATREPELKMHGRPDLTAIPESLRNDAWDSFEDRRSTDPRSGIVLTDDFNPLEYWDARNRESIRRGLARAFRAL